MGAYVKLLEYGRLFEDLVQGVVLTISRQH
jgi:hypothetical protein